MRRREFGIVLSGLIAAPLVVRTAGLLMPARRIDTSRTWHAADEPRGLGDGSSWQNAAPFYAAMASARSGDRVMMTEGTYVGVEIGASRFRFVSRDFYRETRTYNIIGGHNA